MSNQNQPMDELFDAACNGTLSDSELQKLQELAATDPAACDEYLEYCQTHAGIRFTLSTGRAHQAAMAAIDGVEDDTPVVEPVTPNLSPSQRLKKWVVRHPMTASYTAASVIMFAALAAMSVIFVSNETGTGVAEPKKGSVKPAAEVARLVHTVDAVWKATDESSKPPRMHHGLNLRAGQRVRLESGLAEIKFFNGAEVVLEGPAEFEVRTTKQGRLESGKLVAKAYDEKAKGFKIETPWALVEDLGTEFGVNVARGGVTAVHVFDGKVKVDGPTGASSRSVELAAGEGVRVDSERLVSNTKGHMAAGYVRVLPVGRRLTSNAAILIDENFAWGRGEGRSWKSEARTISNGQEWVWSSPDDSVNVSASETWEGEFAAKHRDLSTEYDHDQNTNTPPLRIPGGLELMSTFSDRDGNKADTVQVSVQVTLPETLDEQLEGKLTFFVAERGAHREGETAPRVSVHNVTEDRELLALTPLASEKYPNTAQWQYRTIPVSFTAADAGDTIEVRFQDTVSGGNTSARGLQLAALRFLVAVRRGPAAKDTAAKPARNSDKKKDLADTTHTPKRGGVNVARATQDSGETQLQQN